MMWSWRCVRRLAQEAGERVAGEMCWQISTKSSSEKAKSGETHRECYFDAHGEFKIDRSMYS